jgi:hypothetical protein
MSEIHGFISLSCLQTYHPSIGSQSKIPSKLRDSSIASFQPSRSSPSSRSSSPETPMASTSTPTSGLSAQSPPGKKKGRPLKPKPNGNVKALPPKRRSPPTPPPPKRVPDPDYLIGKSVLPTLCETLLLMGMLLQMLKGKKRVRLLTRTAHSSLNIGLFITLC